METFQQLSAKEVAQHLQAQLVACNQTPVHDNPCFTTSIEYVAPTSPVPEPSTYVMMVVGVVIFLLWRKYGNR